MADFRLFNAIWVVLCLSTAPIGAWTEPASAATLPPGYATGHAARHLDGNNGNNGNNGPGGPGGPGGPDGGPNGGPGMGPGPGGMDPIGPPAFGPMGDTGRWVSKGLLEAEVNWITKTFVPRVQTAETTLDQSQSVTGQVYGPAGPASVVGQVYGPGNLDPQTLSLDVASVQTAVTDFTSASGTNLWGALDSLLKAIAQLQRDVGPQAAQAPQPPQAPQAPQPAGLPPVPGMGPGSLKQHEDQFAKAWASLQADSANLKDAHSRGSLHRVEDDIRRVIETGNWLIRMARRIDQ
ncbi:MAG: hypothetical protein OWU32_08260 [Firmicutes bacterium]|nr:hypothetical protein [Bacillota bacterium]